MPYVIIFETDAVVALQNRCAMAHAVENIGKSKRLSNEYAWGPGHSFRKRDRSLHSGAHSGQALETDSARSNSPRSSQEPRQ